MSSESLRATRPTPRSNRLPKQNRRCIHFRCHGPTDGQGVSHWTCGMNGSMTSVKLVYAISTFLPLEHAFRDPSGGAETIVSLCHLSWCSMLNPISLLRRHEYLSLSFIRCLIGSIWVWVSPLSPCPMSHILQYITEPRVWLKPPES